METLAPRTWQSQRGFINPFVDFLFGTFGSFLVLSVVMLALIGETAEDPLTGFILIEFENRTQLCPAPGKVMFGTAIATSAGMIWSDKTNPNLRFFPGTLSTNEQLIVFRGFKLDMAAELYVFLAEVSNDCRGESYDLTMKQPGNQKQRITLRAGSLDTISKSCKLGEDMKLKC